ncbi:MAG: 30S ribosomal protein S6 [bacterium]|nr:30S ribosomal protein S6 [bacterium]
MIQHYELLMIFPVNLEEKQREEVLKKIFDSITHNEGKVQEPKVWGNQKLAYDIKHQTNGFYILVEFDQESNKLQKMDADMRLMPELLRYLITKKKVKTEATIAKEKMIQEKIAEKKNEAAKQVEVAQKKEIEEKEKVVKKEEEKIKRAKADVGKISLDDLDEKLDEILKEEI